MELACSAPWIPSLIVFEISKEPVNKTDLSINYAMLMPQVILPRNLTFQLINLIPQVGFPIKCFFFRYFRKNINGFRLPTVKIYQHIYSFFDFQCHFFSDVSWYELSPVLLRELISHSAVLRRTMSRIDMNFSEGAFIVYVFLNMLIREYNLTIKKNNQKLFISVQTENNKNKI